MPRLDKPHVRMTERVVAPEKLDFVDVATSSHNHTDHLDAETLLAMRPKHLDSKRTGTSLRSRRKCDSSWPVGLKDGASVEVGGVRFHGVCIGPRARGSGFLWLHRGPRPFPHDHPADTVLYDGMIVKLRRMNIDLALLPINGTLPERCVAGICGGREAAWLAHEIGAGLTVPCHYDVEFTR